MDRSHTLTLIAESYELDELLVMQKTETKRIVFCDVRSVTQSEWFEGGRNGLNPEYRFTMFAPEYHGETVCEFNGVRYAIYRTYLERNELIELYVQKEQGSGKDGNG